MNTETAGAGWRVGVHDDVTFVMFWANHAATRLDIASIRRFRAMCAVV